MEENNFLVNEIQSEYLDGSNENVFETLMNEYKRVIFRSIITSFGLDTFIKDQYGGDVDTVHNVRNVGIDPKINYKSELNSKDYENRGEYNFYLYHDGNKSYQKNKHDARKDAIEFNNGVTTDTYTGKEVAFSKHAPASQKASLDHILAAKTIHDDRGRVLAGLNGSDLANSPENLTFTNSSLNSSMRDKDIPDYIAAHPELPDDVKNRMMDAYNKAKASYDKKINKAYYFDFKNPNCRRFYAETAVSAIERGWEMSCRQALGFLFTELFFYITDEWRHCDKTLAGAFKAVQNGLIKWNDEKENYKKLFAQFGEGFISGLISSIANTLCNTLFTTTENMGRIIRQSWAAVVEATSIILFNPNEKYLCDRLTSAAKVLASGASAIVGTSVQEAVHVKLTEVGVPSLLNNIISTFTGSLCTGVLSVSLLFYIDNDPFANYIEDVFSRNADNLKSQEILFKQYCAELEQIDLERFDYEISYVSDLSVMLQSAKDDTEINGILKQAALDLGLPSLWGEETLDSKMKDKTWTLSF